MSNYEIKNTEEIDVYQFLEPKSMKKTQCKVLRTENTMPLLDDDE